ncbi:MAG: major capsid protein [Magnetococcales bacterium]|nr:major capsid protein [Magnetococcales bacterium]
MSMNASQVRVVDPVLSRIALGYKNATHVGSILFPHVPVLLAGGKILRFGKESFKLYSARRAPGSNTKRVDFGYESDPYTLAQESLEGKVPREHLREAQTSPGLDLGRRATTNVMRLVALSLEYEQGQLATNANNYDSDHKVTLSGTSQWSDGASDPTGDINAGKEAIRASVGVEPNVLLLSAKAFNALKNHPTIIERIKYTGRDSVTPDLLAGLWDLERVVVGKAVTSDDAGTLTDVWGKDAVLAYVPASPSGMEEPSFGYTYTLKGHPLVERPYYDNNLKSWLYPVTYERLPVLTSILSGYLIKDAVD